ncbi:MAG: alginate lyase family protein, partial [Prevotella sp.]
MTKRLLCIMLWLLTMLTISARDFSHPGGMLSQTDLNRIKTHVEAGDEPWASLWKEFQNCSYAKATYTASPNTEVGGSDGNRQRAAGDAYAALLNAIEWHVTGETKYADCAAKILTAWGNKITSAKDELFQYPCRAFITAAEMLRTADGFYTGWDETDRNTFLNKVRTVMVPACRQFCTYQGTHPSWFTPCALAVLGAGVLLDDEDLYNEGYALMMNTEHWGTMYGGSIEPYGQVREMGRDNVHGQLTFCDIALACMFAWNQGDDMFGEGDNRLLRGMNYWCRYNTGHTDTPFEMTNNDGLDYTTGYSSYYISTHNNGFRLRPSCYSFEAVYHHYREVKGISDDDDDMRYLALAAKLARPDSNTEMLGFGTLLFTIDPNTSEYMTEVPERPAHVNAEPCYGGIRISWQHPEQEDARGFRIYRSSNGDLFQNIVEWDYYTNNEYIDDTAEEGKTYYYKVRFINKAGLSEYSDAVTATRLAADESLPEGWTYVGLGSSTGGSGAYIDVQDSTFIVNGIGSDIGGTNDQCGFIYKQMKTKNFTFT